MIILGLDPAIRTTGYGVIEAGTGDDTGVRLLDCGVIANKASLPHSQCLHRLYCGIEQLLEQWHPEQAAMEEPFVGRNAKTAIILGMARGSIVAALANHELPVFTYTPAAAKKAAAGSGAAEKGRIAFLLANQFGLDADEIPLDSTDALAIAICHMQKVRIPELYAPGKRV